MNDTVVLDDFSIRPARLDEAADLAALIDIAGRGLPCWLWSSVFERDDGASIFEIGRERARRDSGGFSWRNAWVAAAGAGIGGMVLGYRLADVPEATDLAELPPVVRPLAALEAEAPGTWYLNAIATYREFRGIGLGDRLLQHAAALAQQSGAAAVSLIAEDVNDPAMRLYRRHGFQTRASRPFVHFPSGPAATQWLLMVRDLQ